MISESVPIMVSFVLEKSTFATSSLATEVLVNKIVVWNSVKRCHYILF